jgi:hypothetical protein
MDEIDENYNVAHFGSLDSRGIDRVLFASLYFNGILTGLQVSDGTKSRPPLLIVELTSPPKYCRLTLLFS